MACIDIDFAGGAVLRAEHGKVVAIPGIPREKGADGWQHLGGPECYFYCCGTGKAWPQRPPRGKILRSGGCVQAGKHVFMMEFHISREARERYEFSDTLFSFNGNVVFADMPACRTFAYRMNQVREADKNPDSAVHAGALF